jgi:hypothetical protein
VGLIERSAYGPSTLVHNMHWRVSERTCTALRSVMIRAHVESSQACLHGRYGADVNQPIGGGDDCPNSIKPIDLVMSSDWRVGSRQLEIARYLVQKGADIIGAPNSMPQLVNAAHSGWANVMDMLLDMGADASVTFNGRSALFYLIAMRAYGPVEFGEETWEPLDPRPLDSLIEKVRSLELRKHASTEVQAHTHVRLTCKLHECMMRALCRGVV